jgi:hypothetical protein
MENFNHQFQINKKEQEAVEWGWSKEGGDTMFNIVNAYTRGSQFEGVVRGVKLSSSENWRDDTGDGRLVQNKFFTTESQRSRAATKFEARNPKFETDSNDQNPNDLNKLEVKRKP